MHFWQFWYGRNSAVLEQRNMAHARAKAQIQMHHWRIDQIVFLMDLINLCNSYIITIIIFYTIKHINIHPRYTDTYKHLHIHTQPDHQLIQYPAHLDMYNQPYLKRSMTLRDTTLPPSSTSKLNEIQTTQIPSYRHNVKLHRLLPSSLLNQPWVEDTALLFQNHGIRNIFFPFASAVHGTYTYRSTHIRTHH